MATDDAIVQILFAMILIAMVYENVCSTARAAAAAAGLAYVPATLLEYEVMIAQNAHAAYVVAAAPMIPLTRLF